MQKTANIFILALCICSTAFAQPLISGVMYNPSGSDSGYEWVELYNDQDTNYRSSCQLHFGNGAQPDDWKTQWEGSLHIAPYSYFLIGEEHVLPQPDAIASLSLQNGPDAIMLNCSDSQDLVGWGEHTYEEYYVFTPAPSVAEDHVLSRKFDGNSIQNTQNNEDDFVAFQRIPRNSLPPISTSIEIILHMQQQPSIDKLLDCSDDMSDEGIQLYAALINEKEFTCTIQGNLYHQNISVISYSPQDDIHFETQTNATFHIPFWHYDEPGIYRIELHFNDIVLQTFEIEYLSSIGIQVTPVSLSWENLGINQTGKQQQVTLKNLGNTRAQVHIHSTFTDTVFFVQDDREYMLQSNVTLTNPLQQSERRTIHLAPKITASNTHNLSGKLHFEVATP